MEVHRCRFADYVPSAINSLQFAPATASTKYPYLAVGRANGEIELWNSRAGFTLEKVIPGGSGKNNGGTNLEAVAWAHQVHLTADDLELFDEPEEREERVQRLRKAPPRLFSAGLNAAVIEWDLGTLSPKKVVDSYGGSVWCMAVNHAQTILAIGTEDGRVRLFDIVDNSLSYARSFDSINTRILCMAWLPDDDGIVTGSADGTIRRWDVSTGHCLSRMTVERDGSDPSLIWSILALSDSTIVSGDSRGYVTFWDGRMDVISQKFNTHGADVLCLVADKAGNAVYCSGVDPKVVVLHRQSARGKNRRSGSKWVMAGFRRYHTNDVRAIAVDTTRPVDALVTGGVDTQMAVCPADKFPNQPQRRMPCFPPMRCRVMSVASGARLFMQQHRNQLKVWRLGAAQPIPQDRRDQMETGHSMPVIKEPQMLLQMDLKTSSTLICSAISSDGTWIAASDNTQIKLFYVRTEDDMPGDQDFLSVKKVQDFPPANLIPVNLELKYATQLAFTPDGGKLIVTTAECMVVVIGISRLESGEWEFTVLRRFAHHRASEDERDDDHENNHDGLTVLPEVSHCTQDANMRAVRTMNSLAISPDGRWLATGDSLNRFHVFDLASLQHQAAVPQLSSAIANPHTAVTFRCHPHESRLVFATANKEIYEWDVEIKDLSSWSKHYSH
ncbi:U3 small nucleolar RNA-associated protein, partial [Spiromyces aspiralis]